MKDEDIANIEAGGFAHLKWEAQEKRDINLALEMQQEERKALLRLIGMTDYSDPEDPTLAADYWK